MHKQFYKGMTVSNVLDQLKPKLVLEIGFGAGTNLMMLLCYTKKPGQDYNVISLSDAPNLQNITIPNDFCDRFLYISGISYAVIPKWKDLGLPPKFSGKIDLCIIDSDHNYFTLKSELEHIDEILSDRCAIVMHDTASVPCEHHLYYAGYGAVNLKSNSMIQTSGYLNKAPYPGTAVLETHDLPMMKAIEEFLWDHKDYKMIRHIDECCGCTMIGRNFDYAYEDAKCN